MFHNHQSAIIDHQSLSGRWDSNPRPSPWQGDILPLNYARTKKVTFLIASPAIIYDLECREPESDWRHRNFQSRALPTELSRPKNEGWSTCLKRPVILIAPRWIVKNEPADLDPGWLWIFKASKTNPSIRSESSILVIKPQHKT